MATSAGFQSISLLNVNALYIQGVPFNDNQPSLQAEIDAINAQLVGIEAVTNKIDTTGLTLPPQCIITNATTNQALKTLIDNINVDIAKLNKFDLTGLPAPQTCIITTATTNQALQTQIDNITVGFDQKFDLSAIPAQPPGAIIITPTTTNQALKTLIDANTASVAKFDLTAMAAAPPATITITPTTTNQALKTLIDTNATNITTIQGQITTINGQITTINNKIAHWNNFTLGSDSMCGVNDGTGFAVALSGSASGNGIFVYPNSTSSTAQIQLATAYDKEILIRGGNAVKLYGGNDGSMLNRNAIEIGDVTDRIEIGRNQVVSIPPKYPLISIGVDTSIAGSASTTEVEGDIYFSSYSLFAPGLTPVLCAETTNPAKLGNTNNYTSDPTFSGLDVIGVGVAPITLSAGTGLIAITALLGGITLTTGAGVMSIACGAGGFALSTGAGALSMNTGAGIMNLATSSAPIEMSTLTGNISIGPGKAAGGSAGNLSLNAAGNVIIQPDTQTEIYKGAFLELNDNATAPPVTANRLYQQADALYWNGQLVQGGSGNQYVLKTGDTMTGTLVLPEADTAILQLDNLTVAPTPVTNRLYLLNNVLTFNGVAVGGGGGNFVLKTGDTMTGALNISYDAGQVTPQLNLVNTNNTAPVASQGATIVCRNDATGIGSVGERCGQLVFSGKDSVGNGGRSYGSVQGFINDPTTSAIDGRMAIYVASNNSQVEMLRLLSTTTAVRQCNISANYTTIGANALGSTATSNLTVQGTTNSTVSLQTPQINGCPEIYPATSTTLVDGAVKRYRPERVFKVTDYPNPLTAPTIDGEKVIILNAFGNPVSQVDSILQASDFPAFSGGTFSNIVLSKYVDATAATPAMNVIAAQYNTLTHLFVQPDVAGVLSLIHVATFNINGQANVADFCVTTFQNKTRIYVGGGFSQIAIPAPNPVTVGVNNFSGRITVTWGAGAVTDISQTAMLSTSMALDSSSFSGIDGVNNTVNCVIDVTGNAGFPQPAIAGDKYDSIVIGGFFGSIGPGSPSPLYRPFQQLAYYDYSNAVGGQAILFNQSTNVQQLLFTQDTQVMGSFNGNASQTVYLNMTFDAILEYLGGTPPQPSWAAMVAQIKDTNGTVLVQSPQKLITLSNTYLFQIPTVTIPAGAGNIYTLCLFVTNFSQLSPNTVQTAADSAPYPPNPYGSLTGTIATEPIGWRTFQSANWATPEGPSGVVYGGGLCSSGYLAFAYQGNQVITATTALASDSIFAVYYMSGTATWTDLNDADLIQSGSGSNPDQTWNYLGRNVNCVTGGNPGLAYGAGNAIAYNELYFNTGFSATSLAGVSFRRSNVDPYEMTDVLVINGVGGAGLATNQLLPQFSSQICYSVYRDDTKYQDVYFLARGTQLDTAVPPFSSGVPVYSSITNAGQPIPCFTFGGYSDEVGYTGALFATNTNLYVYKFSAGGELVIELSGCTVRTFNDVTPSAPILATNKLTFPVNTDGGSVFLCGDISTNPASWWAISQDGPLYYDNTLIGGSGGGGSGITTITAGTNIGIDNTIPTAPVVSLSSPLTSTLNIGEQQLTATDTSTPGTTNNASYTGGYATLTNNFNKLGSLSPYGIQVADNTSSENVSYAVDRIEHNGAGSFTINQVVVGQNIALNTDAGKVTTNCPFKPTTIHDTAGVQGTNGQVLSSTAGGLAWINAASTASSGTLVCNLGKFSFSNLNTAQPSVSTYFPLWDGVTVPLQSGICIIGQNNFVFSIDSFNQYTYLTWNGANPITVNILVDCSWYSTSGTPFPTGADSEFTSAGGIVNAYAYSAVNFGVEIQELAGTAIPQVIATSLGPSAISWLATYGGTMSGTAYMKTGSYLRLGAKTNYAFNTTAASAGTYFASCNFGGADVMVITAYESPYPA